MENCKLDSFENCNLSFLTHQRSIRWSFGCECCHWRKPRFSISDSSELNWRWSTDSREKNVLSRFHGWFYTTPSTQIFEVLDPRKKRLDLSIYLPTYQHTNLLTHLSTEVYLFIYLRLIIHFAKSFNSASSVDRMLNISKYSRDWSWNSLFIVLGSTAQFLSSLCNNSKDKPIQKLQFRYVHQKFLSG